MHYYVFSDILVIPHALGWDVTFEKGEGPLLKKFESEEDLKKLTNNFSIFSILSVKKILFLKIISNSSFLSY